MCNTGWLKRALPFLATFAMGLFIASFFVNIGPRFGSSERRIRRFEQMQRLMMENDELREENDRLRDQLDRRSGGQFDDEESFTLPRAVEVPLPPPPPPRPVRLHR